MASQNLFYTLALEKKKDGHGPHLIDSTLGNCINFNSSSCNINPDQVAITYVLASKQTFSPCLPH